MKVSLTHISSGITGIPPNRLINGKPLFHHVVLEALKVPSLNEVWVCTESEHFALMVPPGALVHKRPEVLTEDNVPIEHVIMDFLKSHPYISTLVLLEATSPTIKAKDIEESLRLSASGKGFVSVQPSHADFYNGNEPIMITTTVRQEANTFKAAGGIYVIHTADFLRTHSLPTFPCITMELPHPVCDIHTERDLDYAEKLLRQMSTAFIDIDETYVQLQSYSRTDQWKTSTLSETTGQLTSFIINLVKSLYEDEIYLTTGGVITEEGGLYLISDAPELVPFLKGTSFPKFVDTKSIKMRPDGDCAVKGMVLKNKIQEKNILLLLFGTNIESGLYIHGELVECSSVGKLLEPEFSTNLATSDPNKLVQGLDKIKMILALDDVYVSGAVLKYKHFMDVLAENGIKLVDSHLNICSHVNTSASEQHGILE